MSTYLRDRGYLLDIQLVPRYGTYQRDSSNRYHLVHIKYLLLGFGNDRIVKPSGKFVQNSLKVGESFDSRFIPKSLQINFHPYDHLVHIKYFQHDSQLLLELLPKCYWLSTTNRYLIMSTTNMLLISIIMSTQIIGDCKPHRGASKSF